MLRFVDDADLKAANFLGDVDGTDAHAGKLCGHIRAADLDSLGFLPKIESAHLNAIHLLVDVIHDAPLRAHEFATRIIDGANLGQHGYVLTIDVERGGLNNALEVIIDVIE